MKKTEPNCIFCKIVRKEIPGDVVYEDEHVLAFNDINPQAPVHVLIIPKDHIPGVNELEEADKDTMCHLMSIIRKIAQQKKLDKSGYRIVINSGKDAGQAVQHIHYHLLGGRTLGWPPG
jgi:histidine triad (HIT) family protein